LVPRIEGPTEEGTWLGSYNGVKRLILYRKNRRGRILREKTVSMSGRTWQSGVNNTPKQCPGKLEKKTTEKIFTS